MLHTWVKTHFLFQLKEYKRRLLVLFCTDGWHCLRFQFCAAKLVPLVGKVAALFYTDSWYCLRLQLYVDEISFVFDKTKSARGKSCCWRAIFFLALKDWFRWLVKLLRCFIPIVGIACASSYKWMKPVLSLTKLKAQEENLLLKNGFFTCATELVPLVDNDILITLLVLECQN